MDEPSPPSLSATVPGRIGERVRAARRSERLSQDERAALAGASRRPIDLLESGRGAG